MHYHKAKAQKDELNEPHEKSNRPGSAGHYVTLQFVQPDLPYDVCRPTRAPENPDHGYQNTNKNNNYSVPAGGYAVVQPVQRNKSYDVCTSAPRPIHKHQGQSVITQGVRFTEGPKHKAKRKPNQR
jgi:hypothetical protein